MQGTELDMRKYLGFVSEKRAWGIVSGVHMRRFKDLTLEAKACRMVDLPGQKVSFMRREPDIDITKPEDRGTRYKPGEYRKHLGRMGFDVTQVYIPIIEKSGVGARIGDKTSIRIESFMCEEKGDK
ncbi:unnamed protein product [marine sediment metagenome]|uniref:Uncharacterized protein n=1 Tax=marine sediment metagenome TaxID=412755 RepID=X1VW99_9ZZZZ